MILGLQEGYKAVKLFISESFSSDFWLVIDQVLVIEIEWILPDQIISNSQIKGSLKPSSKMLCSGIRVFLIKANQQFPAVTLLDLIDLLCCYWILLKKLNVFVDSLQCCLFIILQFNVILELLQESDFISS